jgi:hypothetical protein
MIDPAGVGALGRSGHDWRVDTVLGGYRCNNCLVAGDKPHGPTCPKAPLRVLAPPEEQDRPKGEAIRAGEAKAEPMTDGVRLNNDEDGLFWEDIRSGDALLSVQFYAPWDKLDPHQRMRLLATLVGAATAASDAPERDTRTPWTIDGSMPLPVCLNDTVRRADVVTMWNDWRCGLPADAPFRHSDGVAFLNKLNELESASPRASAATEPDIELVAAVGRIIVNASRAEAQFDDSAEIVRLTKAIQQDARGIVRKWAALSSPSPAPQ